MNPLVDDRDVHVILDELLDLSALQALPYFADHDRESYEMVLDSARSRGFDQTFASQLARTVCS